MTTKKNHRATTERGLKQATHAAAPRTTAPVLTARDLAKSSAAVVSRTPMTLKDVYCAPGHLIRRCQQIAVAFFFDELSDFDVTPVQYAALVAINDGPGIDQRTLVNLIAIDRSTVGTMLKRLEERGLLRRIKPKHNQRIKQLFITPAGRVLLRDTRGLLFNVQERILRPLSPNERVVFMRYLARIIKINNEFSRAPLRTATHRHEARSKTSSR